MSIRNKAIVLVSVLVVGVGIMTWRVSGDATSGGKGGSRAKVALPFRNVDIVTSNAAVEVLPTDRKEATVSYTGKNMPKKYTFVADIRGDTLHIRLNERRWRFFDFDFSRQPKILVVELPEKLYEQIQVKSGNGKIDVGNIGVDQLSLQTDNGTINVQNVKAGITFAETDNGKINLAYVKGEINGFTDNGDISLKAAYLHEKIDLETDNGGIEVKVDEMPTDAKIDVSTDNGRVDIFGQSNSSITYGNGTYLIKLKTDNGNIDVTK